MALPLEQLGNRDGVDGLVALVEPAHGIEDESVFLAVELLAAELFTDQPDGLALEQHSAQDGPLRVQVERGHTLGVRSRTASGQAADLLGLGFQRHLAAATRG
jgi:hypothetical protein